MNFADEQKHTPRRWLPRLSGTLLAGLMALCVVGCQTIQIDEPCPRNSYWRPDTMDALPLYQQAFDDVFAGNQNERIHDRLAELESYCWMMRLR